MMEILSDRQVVPAVAAEEDRIVRNRLELAVGDEEAQSDQKCECVAVAAPDKSSPGKAQERTARGLRHIPCRAVPEFGARRSRLRVPKDTPVHFFRDAHSKYGSVVSGRPQSLRGGASSLPRAGASTPLGSRSTSAARLGARHRCEVTRKLGLRLVLLANIVFARRIYDPIPRRAHLRPSACR